jgi:hypothetical protein
MRDSGFGIQATQREKVRIVALPKVAALSLGQRF